MKKKLLIILLVILIFFLFILTIPGNEVKTNFVKNITSEKDQDLFFLYDISMYPSNVNIIKLKNKENITVGLVGDIWNLNFGHVPIGVESRRFINLANNKEENFRVTIKVYGNISPMINFDKNDFILHKGEEVKITVLLNSTLSPGAGNFTGEIDIISKKAKFPFLEVFL